MTIVALAAVPAAPSLLTQPSSRWASVPDELLTLRGAVDDALTAFPPVDTVVLLASGSEGLVHDASRATLASFGHPDLEVDLHHDPALLTAVAARGQASLVRDDHLDGDLAVLALLVQRLECCVLPVSVPAGAGAESLGAVTAGLERAAEASGRRVGVIAASDLAVAVAGSDEAAEIVGAAAWDSALVDAVHRLDLGELTTLGPAAATRVQARGWAPLTVLCTLAAHRGRGFDEVTYLAPRGVGQLVVH